MSLDLFCCLLWSWQWQWDKVFYSLTGLRVPAKVVGHSDEGYVELEYHQGGVWVVNQ